MYSISTYIIRFHSNNNHTYFHFSLSSISMIFCIIPYCILRIQTNCGIAISGSRSTEMCSGRVADATRKEKGTKKDGGRERIGCGRENEREWHLHWLTAKSHLIKMSERRARDESRQHGLNVIPRGAVPARFGLGDEGAPAS